MIPYLKENYCNPSSKHDFGRKTRLAIEEAREIIAGFINAAASEIYFVSNGTEANNFPVLGISEVNRTETGRNQVLISAAEHSCVVESAEKLKLTGYDRILIPVDQNCKVVYEYIQQMISDKTSLLSFIQINNETGSVNDLIKIIKSFKSNNIYVHTDAVQSFGKIRIDVKETGVDSLSAAGHKIYGPKGIGCTYIKSGTPMTSMIVGGSQERNRRGGTENVAAIIGLAEAVKLADKNLESNREYVETLRNKFINEIKQIDSTGININCENNPFPYIVNFTLRSEFYNNDAEAMLMYLDINGIAVSNGAACTSGTLKPSRVIMAMGYSPEDANGSFRISFSPKNTLKEVEYAIDIFSNMCRKFRI
jgi:cysteine desulfurase